MRRLLPSLLVFLALVGLVLALPVLTSWGPEPEPVATKVESVVLGSVAAPASVAEVRPGPTAEVGTGGATDVGAGATGEVPADPPEVPAALSEPAPTQIEPAPTQIEPAPTRSATAPTLTVRRTDVAPFSMVGVTWAYDGTVTDTVIHVRVQDGSGTWGGWTEVGIETATPEADANSGAVIRGGTSPLWTGPSTGIEVELITRSGGLPTDVQLDLIDPGASPADAALETPAIQDTADAAVALPPVFSRAQWGADEGARTGTPKYAGYLKAATVHHTADSNAYTADQVPGIMRSIYRYHTASLGWGDIGYNVIADKFGRLWEGRYGGLASTVIGAHAGGFNTGTFGVSMLGNYDVVDTPAPMLEAVSGIIAWKFGLYDVDPRGTTTLTSSGGGTSRYAAGTVVKLPTVFAHRDVGATACPGRYGFARMEQIRAGVVGKTLDLSLVAQRYDSEPALQDLLGSVTRPPTAFADLSGGYAQYENGSLYYSDATGVRALHGPVEMFWKAIGGHPGALRYPTSDVAATADGTGEYATFQKGSIYWSPTTGARAMLGGIGTLYEAIGAESGPLGYPTKSVSWLPDGTGQYATFQKGSIYWSPTTGARVMLGGIGTLYEAIGAESGPLGYPTKSVSWLPDGTGQYATFQKGSIYWSPTTGTRVMLGGIGTLYEAIGAESGPLGYPTKSVSWLPDGTGQYATFQKGSIYWSPTTGTRVMLGGIGTLYEAIGAESGPLGYPTKSVSWLPDGTGQYATFQKGSIYWSPTTGTRVMLGGIGTLYEAIGAETGPLGYPTKSVSWLPDGTGQYATFQKGSIYWSPTTGTRVMLGGIETLWKATGAEKGTLGYPTKSVSWLPDGTGQYATFQKGSIYWSPDTGARAMLGGIETFWKATGSEKGALGYPTKSVSWLPDKVGQFATFEKGSIYWSPTTGARAMLGEIEAQWRASGAERGPLRYPTWSVSWLPDKVGQYARFQGGSMYWSPSSGPRAVRGAFLTAWSSAGAERGSLGYPTSDAYAVSGGSRQNFQTGTITVSTTGRATVVAQ